MIVRTLKTTESVPLFFQSCSQEIVKKSDNVGHLLFDTMIPAGVSDTITPSYSQNFNSVAHYCLEGQGRISINGRETLIKAGTLVAAPTSFEIGVAADNALRICTVLCDKPADGQPIIRTIDDIIGTKRDVAWGNGFSRRMLVKSDGLGFALCQTLGNANTDSALQYRNHFESCYYVSGSGEYVWASGRHPIETGDALATVFIMDKNDAHRMVIRDESICLSVFTPPIKGHETHNLKEGADASSY